MSAVPSLSLPEWTVLTLISERPTHGFAISQLTAPDGDIGRIWHIPRPMVYRAIGRLEQAGLVAPQVVEPGRGPRRTVYAATGEGRRAAGNWLATPVSHIREVRSHLLLKLALLDRAGGDPAGLLQRQQATLQPIASAIRAEQPGNHPFDTVLLAWRKATTDATMTFLDNISRPEQARTEEGA